MWHPGAECVGKIGDRAQIYIIELSRNIVNCREPVAGFVSDYMFVSVTDNSM